MKLSKKRIEYLLNLVLDDFLETHKAVADIEPTNDEIVAAFEQAINSVQLNKEHTS